MKKSGTCPKCHEKKILYIPQVADQIEQPSVMPQTTTFRLVHHRGGVAMGAVEAYACSSCGLVELYLRDPGALIVDDVAVRAVPGPPESPPYR